MTNVAFERHTSRQHAETQRVGLVPDIEARPTLEGIRDGRDEVLDAALRHLLGADADEAAIRRMARRR